MMNLDIQRLSDENRHLIEGFSCVETDEMLFGINAKERRRIRKRSQDMENFLRNEAYEDQERGLSRTYLFVNEGKLAAYLAPVSMRLWVDEYLAEKSDEITVM